MTFTSLLTCRKWTKSQKYKTRSACSGPQTCILNQKRNFRKIGLRGGHTRYERKKKKKKSTPTSNETEISNEINEFQTVHEL